MKYALTLSFDLVVETGDKDVNELVKTVTQSYTNYLGEKIKVTNIVKKES